MKNIGKLYIIGDSYSTFEGCIPEGYVSWYFNGGTEKTDVSDKTDTWWHMFVESTGAELLKNNSWSGTTICNTSYDGAYVPEKSFIGRFEKAVAELSENPPDTLLIFGGTNDNWADSPIGKPRFSNWSEDDLRQVLPAFCRLLTRVKEVLPKTDVTVIINTELKPEIENGMTECCKTLGIKYLLLKEIDKRYGHPNRAGMKQIYEQVYDFLCGGK